MGSIPETANKGLEGIVAATTEISTIHDSTLLYRGYKIEELSAKCKFAEVIYLLWNDKLPTEQELNEFNSLLRPSLNLRQEVIPHLERVAGTKAHSMAKLRTAISFIGLLDPDAENIKPAALREKAARLTASMSAIVCALSRLENGEQPIKADESKTIAWNFLNMLRGKEPTDEEESLFNMALILHADHEFNASTFTGRAVVSTLSDYYSGITAALASLKGPLHGGANEAVMKMLAEIGNLDSVDAFVENAIANKKKVMGIGHRVYKNGDPRAKLLRELSLDICRKHGNEEQHKMLSRIEALMLERKGLMPNVDFYSGLVYTALGIRPRDFTPVFAVSRVAGWSAQIMEQFDNNRIYRPRAHYVGKTDRHL